MDGSKLASGRARGASFQTGVQSGVEADLKLFSMENFCTRYDIDEASYKRIVADLLNGAELPDLHPAPLDFEVKELAEMPVYQEPSKPTIQYRATAFGENIIVQRVEKGHSSNLIIPDNALAKSDIGFVMSVGEKCQSVQVGKLVMFDAFAAHGNEVKLMDTDGIERESLLLKECDVLAILEKVTA